MTTIARALSPCLPHPCSIEHADVVLTFRDQANAWAREAEGVTGGYETDLAAYRETAPPPRFGDHLVRYHRERRAAEGRAS